MARVSGLLKKTVNFCLTDICNIGFIAVLTFGTYFSHDGIYDFTCDDISITRLH